MMQGRWCPRNKRGQVVRHLTPGDRYQCQTVPAASHSMSHLAGTGHGQVVLETACQKERYDAKGNRDLGSGDGERLHRAHDPQAGHSDPGSPQSQEDDVEE